MAEHEDAVPTAGRLALEGRGSGEMAFIEFGPSNRPIDAVFLHANGFNAFTYRRILAPLGDRYRILAVDQRGHGRTTLEAVASGRRDWLDLRDDLLALLASLDVERVVVAGHSMGGTVGVLAAFAAPERRQRLVLFDPVMTSRASGAAPAESPLVQGAIRRRAVFPTRADAKASYLGRGAFKTWPEAVLSDYLEQGLKPLPTGEFGLACSPEWEASGFSASDHDVLAALQGSRCPIDILRAQSGSTFHIQDASLPDPTRIRVSTVPGSTHFLPMERPDLVRASLAAAIDASRASLTTT